MYITKKKLADLFDENEVKPLDNDVDIEDLMSVIKDYENKKEFLKRLKEKRLQQIKDEVEKFDSRINLMKEIIKVTLEDKGHTSLSFPGVGRVNTRKAKDKWVVSDEGKLIAHLSDCLDSDEFNKVCSTVIKIDKKELNKILDLFEKQKKAIEGVEKEKGEKGLTVSFDKNISKKVQEYKEELDNSSEEDFDGIDF